MLGKRDTFGAVEVDEALASGVVQTATDAPGEIVRIRPFKETPGIDAAVQFMRGLHRTGRGGGLPTYAFELWFDERRVKVMVLTPSPDDVIDLVNGHYRNSSVQTTGERFPRLEPGDHVAVGRVELQEDCIYPTKDMDSTPPLDEDPYKTMLPKAVGRDAADERTVIQVVFRPVADSWYTRGKMGADGDVIAENVKKGKLVGELNPRVVQSDSDKKKAKDIQDQRGKPAFSVDIRVVTIASDPQSAISRADAITAAFDEYDHDYADQGFEPVPLRGKDVQKELKRAARREHRQKNWLARWLRGPDDVLTAEQLGAVAHIPNAEINVPDVDWSRMESGPGVPPDAPQLDFGGDADEKPAHAPEDGAGGAW